MSTFLQSSVYNRRMITWSCYESVPCQNFCHLSQVAGVLRFCCTSHCCCCFTVENHVCHQSRSRSLALGQLCVAVARYHKRFLVPRAPTFLFFKLLNDPTADQKIVGSGNEDAIKETTGLHAQVAERADKEDEVNWSSWSTK